MFAERDEAGNTVVPSSSSPATTTVRISVRDVNDHAPVVTITPTSLSGTTDGGSGESRPSAPGVLTVAENSENGTIVGHVTVTDRDNGRNGEVECQLRQNDGVGRVELIND